MYNRGVEKRIIFADDKDYRVFLRYVAEATSPRPDPANIQETFTLKGEAFKGIPRQPKNFCDSIEINAYCLMPNHFHLLLKQKSAHDMNEFVQSICTRYSMYFNKRHKRTWKLFQGPYKASNIDTDEYLLHVSRYIHRNPFDKQLPKEKHFSSYPIYLGLSRESWVKPNTVLAFFTTNRPISLRTIRSYKSFVEDYEQNDRDILGDMIIEHL